MLVLTPEEVLVLGFCYYSGLPVITIHDWKQHNIQTFKQHYGSSPTVIAIIWADLQQHNRINTTDKSYKGFKNLLIAIHFLWSYPKNMGILASAFCMKPNQVSGKNLWRWVLALASLKELKFVWPVDEYSNENGRIFIVSVDGVDFKVWEKKHPEFPYDKGQYSQKFNHGALKYEIAIDIYTAKVVWISGPYRGGEHDKTIYNNNLRNMIPPGKKVIVDRVYSKNANQQDQEALAMPRASDDLQLTNFKARVRSRHESFNGRIKFFRSLYDTYHHNSENHVYAFEAICIMVQYQMDHGSPIFSV